jgi:Flp pilus assembly protein TadG
VRRLARVPLAFRRDSRGTAAIEFAMVIPAFIMLIVGGFYAAGFYFAATSMQYAIDAGARCASINTATCPDTTSTLNYVKAHFAAASEVTPTFTASVATCGHNVTGSVTYVLDTGLQTINIPISASACYP